MADELIIGNRNLFPSFREEDQEMAPQHLEEAIIYGPPAFSSPDPATNNNRLVPIEEHPRAADLSEDYGQTVRDTQPMGDPVPLSTQAPEEMTTTLSENREGSGGKKEFQVRAKQVGVSTSGSEAELRTRVEKQEAVMAETEVSQEDRDELTASIRAMKREDLDAYASELGMDPKTYTNKDQLAEAVIQAELSEES